MDLDLGMPKIARANHLSGQIPNTVTTRIEGLTLEGKPLLTHTLVTYFHHPIDGFAYAVMYFSVPESLIKFIADETTVQVTYQGEQHVLLESFRNHRFGHIKLPRSMNKSDGVLGERLYIGYSMISLPQRLKEANLLNSANLSLEFTAQAYRLLAETVHRSTQVDSGGDSHGT